MQRLRSSLRGLRTPALAAVFATSCAPSPAPFHASSLPERRAPSTAPPESPALLSETPSPASNAPGSAPAVATAVPIAPAPPSHFPPSDVPSQGESAAADDGHWTPFGDAGLHERAATDPSVIVRTVVRPHPHSRFITVTVAAVDLSRVAIGFVPGTEDLLWANLPVTPESGLVPKDRQNGLIAVMNGGFQPKHGHWGMVDGTTTIAPPRDDGCTLALDAQGKVWLATWTRLAQPASGLRVVRQMPPCLLENGAIHPDLVKGRDKRWAGHAADLATRRRSAVGLDASGTTLFYAIGEEADPRFLAEAMQRVGATTAAELDINWYWTRFLLFGSTSRTLEITSSLIPKMEHQPTSYVERPSTRDFFYFFAK